ncbi:MAG: Crp/Fnr family transcriptional regulator [Proteobacteria bacterium]|nr:Crp/Fnr family transcriptional regulator [Pseudomonadota bacterium]
MSGGKYANLFLAALTPKDLELIQPHLKPVELRQGVVLADPGARVEDILFVESGMISITTTMEDGAAIELASLGREAVVGSLAGLGVHRANARAVVQIAGQGQRIAASDYRMVMAKSPVFLKIVLLSSELSMAQMQQTAACNALHSAERRMCRWIIQVRDRIGDDVLRLTHDFVAQMLAVRRPTVTLIAQELQNAGLIRYRRGEITILDHAGLERAACECVEALRTKTRRVIADF